MIDKKQYDLNNIKTAAYIFFSGYSTGCDWTLETWFKAKEIVRANENVIKNILKEPKKIE